MYRTAVTPPHANTITNPTRVRIQTLRISMFLARRKRFESEYSVVIGNNEFLVYVLIYADVYVSFLFFI